MRALPASLPAAAHAFEREVVQLLAQGRGNKEIATALDISIMRKLNIGTFGEVIRYAIRNRIIEA